MKQLAQNLTVTALVFALAACTSSTVIRTNDAAAKIYVDGEYRGKGAVNYHDSKIVASQTRVTIVKDGCEPDQHVFSRNEEFDAGACAGGVFVIFPFLWIMRYKPEHLYEYKCNPIRN